MTRGAKVTLRTMKDAMDQGTQEYSSGLSYLMKQTERGIATVARHLAELRAAGYIQRSVRGGGHKKFSKYRIIHD